VVSYPCQPKLEPWSNKRLIGGFLITDGIGSGVKLISRYDIWHPEINLIRPWGVWNLTGNRPTGPQASGGKLDN